jgi:hypothetical protein
VKEQEVRLTRSTLGRKGELWLIHYEDLISRDQEELPFLFLFDG